MCFVINEILDLFAALSQRVKGDLTMTACAVDVDDEHDLMRFSQIAELFYLLQA